MTDVIFLPGILAAAEVRYRALLDRLPDVNALLKDLEIFAAGQPSRGYSADDEIRGVDAAADQAGLGQFHLYGYSAGAACTLAYAIARPQRVLSVALDELATDFTPAERADPARQEMDAAASMPAPASIVAFMRQVVAPGVTPPAPPAGLPPECARPALYTFGSLSNPRWRVMRHRLERYFPAFTPEEFEGLHHLNISHQAEPDRRATTLRNFWAVA